MVAEVLPLRTEVVSSVCLVTHSFFATSLLLFSLPFAVLFSFLVVCLARMYMHISLVGFYRFCI